MKTFLPYDIFTVDTDWGIGVIDKALPGTRINFSNKFFEFGEMKQNRKESLGLISTQEFCAKYAELDP